MKKIFTIITLAMLSANTFAQTAEWLVAPQYSEIKYFGPKMYKITQGGKIGIIGSDGKVILSPKYDAINLFYEGRAVFVNHTSEGWQVKGVLSEDGTVKYADEVYYLLPDYMFYSEGFLPVHNSDGLYGYLDVDCHPAFKFTKDEVRPFSEGFAVVGKEETFHWIDTSGEQILPRLKNGGTPYGGTNFYNGKAYLWDEDGVFFVLNEDGRTEKIPTRDLEVDYLYRADSGEGNEVTYSKYEQEYSKQWIPEERDGLWTYLSSKGKLLTPFQYEGVEKFADGAAIAQYDSKYGLLHVVEDKSTFYTQNRRNSQVFSAGNTCNCEFQLSIPDKWKGQPITVTLRDTDSGNILNLMKKGQNIFTFSYKPNASNVRERKTFRVEVKNNGIQLWQGEESYSFVQRTKLIPHIKVTNADANSNDICNVVATISNPSSIPVTTTITLTGGGKSATFKKISQSVTIPAHGSRQIKSAFHVKRVDFNAWCAVSTSDGTSKRCNAELKPF